MKHQMGGARQQLRAGILYAATLALELPGVYVRGIFVAFVAEVYLALDGHPGVLFSADASSYGATINEIAWVAMGLPLAYSLFGLAWPHGSGWWWRLRAGGRRPSEREQELFAQAMVTLIEADPQLRGPRRWFVLDQPDLGAAAVADTLMLTRGVVHSPFLSAVLAHELGHLHSTDGPVTAALARLAIPGLPAIDGSGFTYRALRCLWRLAGGGLGVLIMAPFWASWWREREYAADEFAARLGQGNDLAAFLETHALIFDRPVAFGFLSEHSHPPTELRLERLGRTPDPGRALDRVVAGADVRGLTEPAPPGDCSGDLGK